MAYKIKAKYIGRLAEKLLQHGKARVRHVFKNTVYLDAGGELIVITRKGFKAPMNIGVEEGHSFDKLVKPGEVMRLSHLRIEGERIVIHLDESSTYDYVPAIHEPGAVSVGEALVRGAFMVSILYDDAGGRITHSHPFMRFLEGVVSPLSTGGTIDAEALHRLLGYGWGFTPSGDDILTGFLPTLWHLKGPRITIPVEVLEKATTWASGRLLRYAQEGLIDEGLAGFIKAIQIGDGELALDHMLGIVRRGHTSGLEIAIGALIASSIMCERAGGCGVLRRVLGKLIS